MKILRKSALFVLIASALALCAGAALAKLSRGTTMSAIKVESRWGNEKFNAASFKTASPATRAQMAADLMRKNPFKGKTTLQVRETLGGWDGFYHLDMFPAYLISDEGDEAWQLVFMLDRHNLVKEVIVHKNGTPASFLN